MDNLIKRFLAKIGLFPSWMLTKTPMCKHKHSCYENIIHSMYSVFVYGLAIKMAINNVFYISNLKKLLKNLVSIKSQSDNVRFAAFVALMNGLYKLILCVARRYHVSDKVSAPIAGFLAGLTCYFDAKDRRKLLLVMLMARMTDTLYSVAETRGLAKRYDWGAWAFFMVVNLGQ